MLRLFVPSFARSYGQKASRSCGCYSFVPSFARSLGRSFARLFVRSLGRSLFVNSSFLLVRSRCSWAHSAGGYSAMDAMPSRKSGVVSSRFLLEPYQQ